MIGRRSFVQLSALGAMLLALGGCREEDARPIVLGDERTRRAARRAEKLVERAHADAIGRVHRAVLIPDDDAARAAELVEPVIVLLDTDEPIPELRARVTQLVADDLRDDRIGELEGWTLSETELAICLLVHVVEP